MRAYLKVITFLLLSAISSHANSYDLSATVSMGFCSGSIVRYDISRLDDKAMVLTNGHCIKRLAPNQIYFDLQTGRRAFSLINSNGMEIGEVHPERIMYATMTGTDLGLYRLKETYRELNRVFNVNAFTLSRYPVSDRTPIEILSGYWKRGYSCSVEKTVYSLKEYHWTFFDAIRLTIPGCQTQTGASGSPLIRKNTRTVVGVFNTYNENGQACTLNNPCEVLADGRIQFQQGFTYGTQTHWIYSCLDSFRKIDLSKTGCLLPQ